MKRFLLGWGLIKAGKPVTTFQEPVNPPRKGSASEDNFQVMTFTKGEFTGYTNFKGGLKDNG